MVQATIREFYLLTALSQGGIAVISATYVIFLQSKGLNLFEVNMVNFVFFLTLFLCEIPTGAFADVFGRKSSYIVSCAIFASSMIIYAYSESFWGFALAEAVGAIGSTFASGAFRAWFVDKLRHHGYTGGLNPIFAKAAQIRHGARIVSALLGAFLADIWMPLPWLVGSGFFLTCGAIASFLKEEYFTPRKFSLQERLSAIRQTVKASYEYGYRSKNVRFVLVLVIMQIFALKGPDMQWQPFFGDELAHKASLGFIWTAMVLSMMYGAWLAPRILRKTAEERKALAMCQITIGIGVAGAAILGWLPISLVLFFLHEVGRGAFEPIKEAYLHDNIPSKERATIESFESLAHHGGGMIGLFVSGVLAQQLGISWTWIIVGTILILVTIVVAKNSKK